MTAPPAIEPVARTPVPAIHDPHAMTRRPGATVRPRQGGFVAVMLVALVLMLALVPAMLLAQSAMERQRVLDAQVKAMLKGAPPRPVPAAPAAPAASAAPGGTP